MFKNILLATDGSEASAHAAELAIKLARAHGAKLTVLYVVDPYPYLSIGETNPLGVQAYMAAAQQHAAQAHAKIAALCDAPDMDVKLEARMAENVSAASGIVQTVKDEGADLVVMGSRGRTGIARFVLGSVASKVAAESPVPVLIAR